MQLHSVGRYKDKVWRTTMLANYSTMLIKSAEFSLFNAFQLTAIAGRALMKIYEGQPTKTTTTTTLPRTFTGNWEFVFFKV